MNSDKVLLSVPIDHNEKRPRLEAISCHYSNGILIQHVNTEQIHFTIQKNTPNEIYKQTVVSIGLYVVQRSNYMYII